MTADPDRLKRLLKPWSVAVIGGGSWCEAVVAGLQTLGYAWEVWPVHPSKAQISSVSTYPSIDHLPGVPDAVFIGVNRHATVTLVRRFSAMGVGGAVCFAAGFSEVNDGSDLQQSLLEAAGDMAIIGPNSYGFVNALDRVALWPDGHGLLPTSRGVAILTQSSNIALNLSMQQRALPIAFIASLGNQAQINLSQLGQVLLEDTRVSALALHVEGFGDIRALEALAETAQRVGKPIIVLKAGRSESAQKAAVSHTASLVGSDAGADALLRRLGMARVNTLESLLEALKIVHFAGAMPTNEIAALSCSGGEASLIADAAETRDIRFSELTSIQLSRLNDILGPKVTIANPLDYQTFIWGDVERMTDVIVAMMQGRNVLTVVIADIPRGDRCDRSAWDCLIEAAIAARSRIGMPLALLATLPENMPEDVSVDLAKAGVIPLHGLGAALSGMAAASVAGGTRRFPKPLEMPETFEDYAILSEYDAKNRLAEYGVTVPESVTVKDAVSAANWADGRGRVVLKATGFAHKSEHGAVAVGLSGVDDVLSAAQQMPGDSFLVEDMIEGALVEVLVSVMADPAHGYVLTVGAGGILTELLKDIATLLLPVSAPEIEQALDSLAIAPLIAGYRGAAAVDKKALVDAILAVQSYVLAQNGLVAEVEINPMIATTTGAVAADALIRLGEKQ